MERFKKSKGRVLADKNGRLMVLKKVRIPLIQLIPRIPRIPRIAAPFKALFNPLLQKNTSKLLMTLMLAAGLLLVLPSAASTVASAAPGDTNYTATVSYYDDVQITYTLNYPSGGIWSGSADVPVGNMGDASDQIYCVDPFVPFHSLADSTTWDSGSHSTVDTKHDYTVAAPWAVSASMHYNGDAVRWLVLNGYRGNFTNNDATSQASVARLNQQYPDIGSIDKRTALMATKVAIWKVLAGNNLQIMATSLDGTSARATFDALVERLVNDAKQQPDWGLASTTFSVDISAVDQENADDGTYDFIGPLKVTATLANTSDASTIANIDKMFLGLSGPEAGGASFITDINDASGSELPSDILYGTTQSAQYISGSAQGTVQGGTWQSDEFYIKVPLDRGSTMGINWSEQLEVKTFAMAIDVPLIAGTPITFVYDDGGVQDWDGVQAFIGAASEDMLMSMYAQDNWQTADESLGQLWVSKTVSEATPLDNEVEFSFQVLQNTSADFATAVPVNFESYPIHGALSVAADAHSFTIKNGGLVNITGLPTDGYYWVVETGNANYSTAYEITVAATATPAAPITGSGLVAGPLQMDEDSNLGMAMVGFTNTRDNSLKTHLYLEKLSLRYGQDPEVPEYVFDLPCRFLLEESLDGGATWQPVADLYSRFTSDKGVIVDASAGLIEVPSNSGVYLELDADAGQIYRVTEVLDMNDPLREFTPMYTLYHYASGDGGGTGGAGTGGDGTGGGTGGDWTARVSTSMTNPGWDAATGPFTTEDIIAAPNDRYFLRYFNINSTFHDLRISKTVAGSTNAQDLDKLFEFQLIYMGTNSGTNLFEPGTAVALSADNPSLGMIVTGVGADRISGDSQGQPTIISLKNGEEVLIKSLPAGNYKLAELNGTGYTASYSLDGTTTLPAAGGITAEFSVTDAGGVDFINTKTTKPTEPTGLAKTGDDAPFIIGGALVAMVVGLLVVGLLLLRRRRHRLRS